MNKLFVIDKTERNTQRYNIVDSRRMGRAAAKEDQLQL